MSDLPSAPYSVILGKLNRTCTIYAQNFQELNKIKEVISKLGNNTLATETESLESIVQFMKTSKSDELAIKLVYLSFIRDLDAFKRRQPIEDPEGNYL